jgi:hypothetical protein
MDELILCKMFPVVIENIYIRNVSFTEYCYLDIFDIHPKSITVEPGII